MKNSLHICYYRYCTNKLTTMKKTLLFTGQILFCAFVTQAQEVISPQGESYSNSSGEVEFTIGETVISTFENGTNGITQGFHQSNLIISSIKDFTPNMDISIYPNPVMNQLTIKLTDIKEGYHFDMVDMNGKLVKSNPIKNLENQVDLTALAAGVYMLILKDEQGNNLKTYQLHKLN